MKKIIFPTALFILCFQTIAFCQTDSTVIKNAVSKLRTLLTDHITEKAYLHLDRPYPYYVAGDAIYFKAYVVKGERHELTNISGMLHVDLINKNDAVIQTEMVQLSNGVGWGDVSLPDTLKKGSYRLRAYTEWMRNEKEPNFFEQYISISSVNNVDRITEATKQGVQPVIQFFPEGGNLVTDIRSKVAFKAVGADGLGANVKGVVVDDANKEIAKINSTHLGMGVFDFLPEEGKKYKAKVTFANGSQSTVDLPAIESKGITLSVNTDDQAKVSIEIKANRAYYKENLNKQLNLLIYWAGAIRTINTKLDNEVLGLDLPSTTFRTGILQVSLLSQTGEPLNERMVFIQNPDLLNVSLNTNKPSFAKREGVQLSMNAKNKDGNPVTGSFSISVVDESKILVDENAENTMLSYLLLTSDLKGYVEKPNYYFANVTKETRANLDALMLTQGYRRFVWKQLLNDNSNTAATYSPEQHLDIAGTIATKTGAPLPDIKVILLPIGLTEKTDAQGHFRFAKVDFQSGTNFILKTPSASGKNSAVLTLDKPALEAIVNPANPVESKYNANADILTSFQNNQRPGVITASNESNTLLKNDKVMGAKRDDNYRSSNLSGPGHADQVIHGDDIRNAPSLSNGLNGKARGVDFVNGVAFLKNSTVVSGAGSATESMLVVVDGTVVGNGASIDNISPSSVETIEILKENNAAIYGTNANAGVIVITTRLGGSESLNPVNKEMSPGVFSIRPQGFYKAREFYSPSYNASQPANKFPDLRTTIFWKPDVITDTFGNASFNYFNADGTATYRVVVEGIDINGNLGRQVFHYKVE
jgi:TonB-dependent Receptor Plug Domain